MTPEEKLFEDIGSRLKKAEKSQMFGKPCLKINGKAFACFYNNEMVFKLNGSSHKRALSFDGSILFDPSGKNRPMKEWVQVPGDYREEWASFASDALSYVSK